MYTNPVSPGKHMLWVFIRHRLDKSGYQVNSFFISG